MFTIPSSEPCSKVRRNRGLHAVATTCGNADAPSSTTLDLDAIRRLQQQMLALSPAPAREFRLHPGDLAELKAIFATATDYPASGERNSLLGLAIVIDPQAERLPRKRG